MTSPARSAANTDPAGSIDELQHFLSDVADGIRVQVDASPVLATPRLTSLRERLSEIAEELDWLRAAMESKD